MNMTDAWSEIMKDAGSGVSGEYFVERDDGRVETMQVLDYVNTFDKWWEPEAVELEELLYIYRILDFQLLAQILLGEQLRPARNLDLRMPESCQQMSSTFRTQHLTL
jgi:hypothetical protein